MKTDFFRSLAFPAALLFIGVLIDIISLLFSADKIKLLMLSLLGLLFCVVGILLFILPKRCKLCGRIYKETSDKGCYYCGIKK